MLCFFLFVYIWTGRNLLGSDFYHIEGKHKVGNFNCQVQIWILTWWACHSSHLWFVPSLFILIILLVCAKSLSHVWLFVTLWTVVCQAPLSMGFSRQEYWSGLPFPLPGDCPHPSIKPASLTSPALAGEFSTTSATWEVPVLLEACYFLLFLKELTSGLINSSLPFSFFQFHFILVLFVLLLSFLLLTLGFLLLLLI